MSTLADLTAAGVSYALFTPQAPEGSLNAESGQETRLTFLVPFGAQTLNFLQTAGGKPTTFRITVGGVATNVTRIIPLQHPEFLWMVAYDISWRAFGGQNSGFSASYAAGVYGTTTWSHNLITVKFRAVPYPLDGSAPTMVVRCQGAGQTVTIPGSSYKRLSDNLPLKQDGGYNYATTAYSITFYQCPNLGDSVIIPYQNCVGSTTFLGWPGPNMLLSTWEAEATVMATGQTFYTRTLNFLYSQIPHNQIVWPDGLLDTPINIHSGDPPYASADLNGLIQ